MIHESIVCCYLYPISKYGYPPAAENTVKHLEEMSNLGFRSVELEGIRQDHLMQVYDLRDEIRQAQNDLGLQVPYFCIVLAGLSSVDPGEREKNLRLFEKGCQVAKLLGAKGVLDNGPLPPYQFPDNIPVVRHFHETVLRNAGFPASLNWQSYWQDLVDTFRTVCDIAAEHDLTYQVHPCLGVLSATTDAFLYFQDAVARENLRFNLDTANQFYLKDNLALSLRRLSPFIDYIHISDNSGLKVEHLAPGHGAIDWQQFFTTLSEIKFEGHLGLDIGGDETDIDDLEMAYKESAEWLQEKWLNRSDETG